MNISNFSSFNTPNIPSKSNVDSEQRFFLLSKLLNQKLELTNFIGCLASCNPENIRSIENLANVINEFSLTCSEAYASINRNLVMNLILKQFPDPLLDGIRELISNANDANRRKMKISDMYIPLGVNIEIANDTISITDKGDGIGLSNLRKFFVPGCSSNKTLLNINEGLKDVTGRFGQGSIAAYYSLIPSSSLETIQKLEFIEDKDGLKLVITCLIDEVPHLITSQAKFSDQGPTFETSYEPFAKPVKRKISIHSWREGDKAIKMKFSEVKGQILLDMVFKPKEEKGTTYKISSPLIKTNESKITDHIKNVFKSVSYPISLNGTLINDTPRKKLNFKGGYISFTPLEEKDKENVKGLLRICESECLILDFSLQDFFVPNEVTINFDRLVLSQERASIDFKNPQTISEMESLIESIVQDDSLTSLERNALFNAFSPIIGSDKFNLTKKIYDTVAISEKEASKSFMDVQDQFSEEKELIESNEDKCLYLNPLYFSPNDHPSFFEGKNYFLYSISTTSEEPLSVLKKDDIYHLFINKKFLIIEHPSEFEYNLHLLNHLLKNKAYPFSIDVSSVIAKKCCLANKPMEVEKENEELPISQASTLDWESYVNVPESKIEGSNDLDYWIEYSSKYFYPQDEVLQRGYYGVITKDLLIHKSKFTHEFFLNNFTQSDVDHFRNNQFKKDLEAIRGFWKIGKSKKHLKYFCDLLISKDQAFLDFRELLSFPLFFKFLVKLFATEISVKELHELIHHVYLIFKNKPKEELEDYLLFLSIISFEGCLDNHYIEHMMLFRKFFKMTKQIFSASNITDYASKKKVFKKWKESNCFLNNIEINFQILNKIALRLADTSAAEDFLGIIPNLIHLNFFETLLQKELENFFKALSSSSSYLHEGMSSADYENIHWLSQKSELNRPTVAKLVELYCIGSRVMFEIYNNPDTGILKQLLASYINEKAFENLEDLSVIVEKMKTFLETANPKSVLLRSSRVPLIKFHSENEEPLFYMSSEEQIRLMTDAMLNKDHYKVIDNLSLRESIELRVEYFYSSYILKGVGLNEFFRKFWEKLGLISTPIRPFIYALLKKENLINDKFKWPVKWKEENTKLLHKDKDVIELLGSEEVAEGRLRGVVAQTTDKNMFVKEFCKNSLEAGASEIHFEVHSDEKNHTIVSIKDNGKGMDANDLKVFKTPNYSTKSQNGNFGQGAMTGLAGYDEMVVTTSKDGVMAYRIAIKKTPQGLAIQDVNSDISHPIGTTILLKKEQGQVLVDLVNLEAELVSSCQYFKGIDISFQNALINKGSKLIVLHEESEDGICVQLGKGEEGIYCNDIRMSSLSVEYTTFLPDGVKEMLEDNKIKLRVFIPHSNQVMNRNFLVKEESVLEKIQALILSASINYYVKQWIKVEGKVIEENTKEKKEGKKEENDLLNVISHDYWNRLDLHNSLPDDELLCTINAIQKRDWSIFAKKDDYKKKQQLAEHIIGFFNMLKKTHELSFDNKDSSKGIEEMLSTALIKVEERLRKQWLESIKSKLTEPSEFVSLLVHYPLNENGLTFMKIRSLLTKVLSEEKITDLNGSFNKDYLETLSVLKLAEIFKSCVDKVIIEFGDDSKKILAKMSKSLIERGRVIIGQKGVKSPDEESWQEKSLEQFFIGIGAKLDKKIAIEFYTAQDGAKAHVKRHIESKIFFNRKEHVANFIDLCTEDVLKGKVSSKFIELIAEMIDTVAHEIVHLNEGADCKSTHDRRFHEELSKLDGKLFVSHETLERSPLALLKEYLPTHL